VTGRPIELDEVASGAEAARQAVRRAKHLAKREVTPTWRYVFNLRPTLTHRRAPGVLGTEARAVAERLRADGVAVTTLEALTGDAELLARLQTEAREIEAASSVADTKPFLVELLGQAPVVDPASAATDIALHPQLRGVADDYFGLRTRVADLNIWRNLPRPGAPSLSQMWHRDLPEDHFIVKAFVYLTDVDEGAGPFCYIPGTHPRGRTRVTTPTTYDGVNDRTTDDDMAAVLPRERWRSLVGPAGTVIFADTRGLHRGGHATTGSRVALQVLYASRSSTFDSRLRLPDGTSPRRWEAHLVLGR
jgi:hypothetical protein